MLLDIRISLFNFYLLIARNFQISLRFLSELLENGKSKIKSDFELLKHFNNKLQKKLTNRVKSFPIVEIKRWCLLKLSIATAHIRIGPHRDKVPEKISFVS